MKCLFVFKLKETKNLLNENDTHNNTNDNNLMIINFKKN
jgi:hypothetical protein